MQLPEQERRPSDPNKIFNSGDFQHLIKKVKETVDLIFSQGIDWSAFLTSFNNLRVEDDYQNLSIKAIEHKDDDTFVVRINTAKVNQVDKGKIEKSFWQYYQPLLEAKDSHIKSLNSNNEFLQQELESKRKENTRLLNLVEIIANKDNQTYNDFRGANIGGSVAGNNYDGDVTHNHPENNVNQ